MRFTKTPLALLAAQVCCHAVWAQAPAAPATATAAAPALPAVTVLGHIDGDRIGQETLEKEPPKNIRDLFKQTVGVDFSATGPGRQLGDIEVRGMGGLGSSLGVGSNRVTLEVDGMDISQSFQFGHNMRQGRQYFDPADLKAVEIHKGPGANGLAGNVQMRTKDPVDYLRTGQNVGGEVRAGYSGDTREGSVGASIAARINNANSASLSYTRRSFHELDNKDGIAMDGPQRSKLNPMDGTSHSLNGKWVIQPNAQHKLTVAAQHFNTKYDTDQRSSLGVSRGTTTYAYRNIQKNERNALSLIHEGQAEAAAFDRFQWQLSAQRTASEGRNAYSRRNAAGVESHLQDNNDFTVKAYALKADFDKTLGGHATQGGLQHDLRYGLKLQHGELEMTTVGIGSDGVAKARSFFPKNKQWQAQLHVANRMQWGLSGFSLTPSLSLTHIRIDPSMPAGVAPQPGTQAYRKTAPGAGLLLEWQPNEQHLLSASYQRATRMPGFGETNGQNYGHWLGRPNPDLKPEAADAVELGWSSFSPLGQQKTAVFYNRYNDMIDVTCESNRNTGNYCDIFNRPGRVKLYGLEWEGRLQLDALGAPRGLALEGGMIYTKGSSANGYAEGRANPFNGHVGLRYNHPADIWGVIARLNFSQGKKTKDLPKGYHGTAGYGVLDLVAHYKPTEQLTLSAGIYNVGDKRYVRWSNYRSAATRPDGAYTEAGRYFGLNVRYQF